MTGLQAHAAQEVDDILLVPGERVALTQQQVFGSGEAAVVSPHEGAMLFSPDLVLGVAEDLGDVKSVEGDLLVSAGDVCLGRRDVGGIAHVHRDELQRREAFECLRFVEAVERALSVVTCDVEDVGSEQIRDHGDGLVALLERSLIDADDERVAGLPPSQTASDRSLHDSNHLVPGKPEAPGYGKGGGLFQPVDDHGLEQRCKARAWLAPGDPDQPNAMGGALDA